MVHDIGTSAQHPVPFTVFACIFFIRFFDLKSYRQAYNINIEIFEKILNSEY